MPRDPGPASRRRAGKRRLDGLVVLVVDDDWDAREILRVMLEEHGARVLTAPGVGEAMRVLDDVKVGAVLADLRMPRESGYDLVERLRGNRRWTKLPVIAVTALASSGDYLRTLSHGFDAHVVKPVEEETLLAVLRRLLPQIPKR
ncbi:MAG: response regulator [Candidatus Rokuibacteriota bacterium]